MNSTPPASRADAVRVGADARKRTRRILLIIILIAVALVVSYGVYWVADRYFAPSYSRCPRINNVAWGVDGLLYLKVQWVVSNDRSWEKVVEFDENAVYEFDPKDRVLRMLRMDDARRIIALWPSLGWIRGRYAVKDEGVEDSRVAYRPVNVLHDWRTGETIPWNHGPIIAISPDDRYLLWRDSRGLPVIHWMDSGRDVPVPDSVLIFKDVGESDGEVTRHYLMSGDTEAIGNTTRIKFLPYRPLYPTTCGLLDPALKLLIDPVSFDTGPGWGPIQFGGGGIQSISPDGKLGESHFEGTVEFRGAMDMALYNTIGDYKDPDYFSFSIPQESVKWRIPDEWKDLNQYSREIVLPGSRGAS